ncbi:MAG: hypothetical protein Q9185_006045 [Variospora sp. 1 TL-2023]
MAPRRTTRRQQSSAQPQDPGAMVSMTGQAFWQQVNQLGDARGNKLVEAFLDLGFQSVTPQTAKSRLRTLERWVMAKKKREDAVKDTEAANRVREAAEKMGSAIREKEAATKDAQPTTKQNAAASASKRLKGRPARKTVTQIDIGRQSGHRQDEGQPDEEADGKEDERENTASSGIGDEQDNEQSCEQDGMLVGDEQGNSGRKNGQGSLPAEQPQDKRKRESQGSNRDLDGGQRETRQIIEHQRQQQEQHQQEKERLQQEKRPRKEELQQEKQRQQEEKRRWDEERQQEKQRQQEEKRQRDEERQQEKQFQQKERQREEQQQQETNRQREEGQRIEQPRSDESSQVLTSAKDRGSYDDHPQTVKFPHVQSQESELPDKHPLHDPASRSSSPREKASGPNKAQTGSRRRDGQQSKGSPHARVMEDANDDSTLTEAPAVVFSQSAAASHAQSRPLSQASAKPTRLMPSRSPLSLDEAGIASLLAASEIPDPLRLGSWSSNKEDLLKTLGKLTEISVNDERRTLNSGVKIIRFVGALFDPSSYWMLRQNMFAYVERTGFRQTGVFDGAKTDHQYGIGAIAPNFPIGHDPAKDARPNAPLKAKEYLDRFAEQWRYFSKFSQQTSTKAVINLTRMRHEELCYSYWCKLQALWWKSNPGYETKNNDHDLNDPEVGGYESFLSSLSNAGDVNDDADSTDIQIDTDAMLEFLTGQMKFRKVELKLRSPEHQAHTVHLLKKLVAPFLGLEVTPRMWTNTMKAGRIVHAVQQTLGWGAFAVVKWESVRSIGPEMLLRILPVIAANHPELKETFQSIERVFIHPLRGSDMRLRVEDVGHFLRINGVDQLRRVCAADQNGFKGVLDAKFTSLGPHVSVTSGWSALQIIEGNGPSAAVERSSTHTMTDQELDDDQSVICNPNEQLLEADSSGEVIPAARQAHGKGPALLPTPPSSTRRAVRNPLKRRVSPGGEESPSKKR